MCVIVVHSYSRVQKWLNVAWNVFKYLHKYSTGVTCSVATFESDYCDPSGLNICKNSIYKYDKILKLIMKCEKEMWNASEIMCISIYCGDIQFPNAFTIQCDSLSQLLREGEA